MSELNEKNLQQQNSIQEKGIKRMEALLKQSAMGIHILFQNNDIAKVLHKNSEIAEVFNFDKMKQIQEIMTQLISKSSYIEKIAYIKELDAESYQLLIKIYFHIVDNTVRANTSQQH